MVHFLDHFEEEEKRVLACTLIKRVYKKGQKPCGLKVARKTVIEKLIPDDKKNNLLIFSCFSGKIVYAAWRGKWRLFCAPLRGMVFDRSALVAVNAN